MTDELKEKEIEGKGAGRNYENARIEKRKGNKNISKKNYNKNARRKEEDWQEEWQVQKEKECVEGERGREGKKKAREQSSKNTEEWKENEQSK